MIYKTQAPRIHTVTWVSPDEKTYNQNDRVLTTKNINMRREKSIEVEWKKHQRKVVH